MKALILSGGKGTRLRPLTHSIAKQLIPVANKPILHYVIEDIITAGITEICIIISPETGDQVKNSVLSADFSADIQFISQDNPNGLADAVRISQGYLKEDKFLMYLGDNLTGTPLKEEINRFNSGEANSIIFLKKVEDPKSFGVAEIEDGKIKRLVEKPKEFISDLALVGLYLFDETIFKVLPELTPSWRNEYEITDAISLLLRNGFNVQYSIMNSWWLDTGKKDDLLAANKTILNERLKPEIQTDITNSTTEGTINIGKNNTIEHCSMMGPVIIGNNCTIKNTRIGPYTAIADDVKIVGSEIHNSILMNGVEITNIKNITESVVGRNATLKLHESQPKGKKFMVGDDNIVEL